MHTIKSKALVVEDKCLILQPALIKAIGKSAALLLQQIHYWISNPKVKGKIYQQKKWIANSYEGWVSDLKIISRSTVNRSIKTLKGMGVLSVEKLSEYKSNRINWYTIDYDRLNEILDANISVNQPPSLKDTPTLPPNSRSKMTLSKVQNEPMYKDKKTNKDVLSNLMISDLFPREKCREQGEIGKSIPQQMVDMWNEIILPENKCSLTKARCRFLIGALKYKFDNNLQKWGGYCRMISSSDYLMGKIKSGFKIALDTALKFDFIQRILEKQFGIKDIQFPDIQDRKVLEEIETTESMPEIRKIRRIISQKLGAATYISWFQGCRITISNHSIGFLTKTLFQRDWIRRNYEPSLVSFLGSQVSIIVEPS